MRLIRPADDNVSGATVQNFRRDTSRSRRDQGPAENRTFGDRWQRH